MSNQPNISYKQKYIYKDKNYRYTGILIRMVLKYEAATRGYKKNRFVCEA